MMDGKDEALENRLNKIELNNLSDEQFESDERSLLLGTSPRAVEGPAEIVFKSPEEVDKNCNTIIVSALSPLTTQTQLVDFFSFCGRITAISMCPCEGDSDEMQAIVTFQVSGAAKTSLLLENALINNRSIKIRLADKNVQVPQEEPPSPSPAEAPRTQTSVIAGLLAKGYSLSEDAFKKAKELDEQHQLARTLDQKFASFTSTVQEYDNTFQISQKGEQLGKTVMDKYREVDSTYEISNNLNNAVYQTHSSLKSGFDYAGHLIENYIETNPEVSQTVQNLKNWGNSTFDSIVGLL